MYFSGNPALIVSILVFFRWTVMSTRVCAANMGSLGTQQFSGFQKDLSNPKSEDTVAI